jgi:hypothetical protein
MPNKKKTVTQRRPKATGEDPEDPVEDPVPEIPTDMPGPSRRGPGSRGRGRGRGRSVAPPESSSSSSSERQPRSKKSYILTEEEEEKLLEWIEENEMIWNSQMKDYTRADKKAARWEDMAEQMGRTSQELQGWWQGIKDQFTKMHRKKSGQAARAPTDERQQWMRAVDERQQWIQLRCKFLERVVRHKASAVRPVSKNYRFIIRSNKFSSLKTLITGYSFIFS